MADIAKFGIEIDPKGAVDGSKKAKKAIREVGDEAVNTEKKVEQANKNQGKTTQRMARTAGGAFKDLTNGIIDLLDGIGLLNNGFGALIRRGQNLTQAGNRLTGGLARAGAGAQAAASGANAAAGGLGAAARAAGAALASLGPLLILLGALAVVVLAVGAAFKALSFALGQLKRGVGLAAEFQKTELALEGLVGSSHDARRNLDEFGNLSATTFLDTKDVQKAGETLLGFGSSSSTVIDELRTMGDIAQGVQAPVSDIAEVYGKARQQGRLFAEDINALTSKNIPLIATFANQLGISEEQVRQLGREGKISFGELETAFITMTSEGGRFQGMLDRTSQTFSAKVSTLQSLWDDLVRKMGEPVRDALAPVLDDLIAFVQIATPIAVRFGELIGNAIRILHQAVADGRFLELLGLTFGAATELFLEGILKAFATGINWFAQAWTSIVDFAGTKLGDALGSAFAKVVNFFSDALTGVVRWFADRIAEVVLMINEATGTNFAGPGSVANRRRAEFAGDPRSFSDILEANKKIDFFGDVLGTPKELVGTTFRDAAAQAGKQLLDKSKALNPGVQDIDRPPLKREAPIETDKAAQAAKKGREESKLMTEQLLEDFGNVQQGIDGIVAGSLGSFAEGFTDAFTAIATGSASASQAFSQMATQIIGDITRMIIQMTIQLAIQRALGIGGAGTGLVDFIGGLPTAHSGGRAGASGLPRTGNGGLSTFHSGGLTGAEAAVKVDRNETILTRARSDELEMELSEQRTGGGRGQGAGEGGQPVQILNVTDQSQVADAIAANPDLIVNAISRRMPAVRNMIINNRKR